MIDSSFVVNSQCDNCIPIPFSLKYRRKVLAQILPMQKKDCFFLRIFQRFITHIVVSVTLDLKRNR